MSFTIKQTLEWRPLMKDFVKEILEHKGTDINANLVINMYTNKLPVIHKSIFDESKISFTENGGPAYNAFTYTRTGELTNSEPRIIIINDN